MSAISRHLKSNKGTALMTSIMVMMMVATLGISYIALTSANLFRANRDVRRTTAFYLAEAGLEDIVAQIMTAGTSNGGIIIAQTYNTTSLLNGLKAGTTGTVWVELTSDNHIATITSSATYKGITDTVQARLNAKSLGVWDNAIFAGIGQSGRGINGNVDIRGSVHILGEGDPFTDLNGNGVRDVAEPYTDLNHNGRYDSGEPFVDTDGNGVWSPAEPYIDSNMDGEYNAPFTAHDLAENLSGSANIGNNYNGIPATLSSHIPALITQNFDGEMVQTLNAELRVKHGIVDISGAAKVGSPNQTGNSIKETLDGTYVSDGFGGNKGTGSVNSDNGTTQKYDLGDKVTFPSILLPYTDPNTGVQYSTYEAWLVAHSLLVTVTTINSSTSSFTYGDGTNSISWNKSTSTLTTNGIVRMSGDLDISTKGSTVNTTGHGTIFSQGSIRVHGNVLPIGTFPIVDALGVIAKYDINFATGTGESQLNACGAWFAERKIRVAKQSQFAGTYVSNYFDMGSNVPSIFQVPALSSHLPPGMPGGSNVIAASIISWKHVRPYR